MAPDGDPSEWVEIGRPHAKGYVKRRGRYSMHLTRRSGDNGDSLLKVEFRTGYLPEDTTWILEVAADDVTSSSEMHASIERGELATFLDHEDEEMTLSIPGTAYSVITVASVAAQFPLRVARSSSYGPTRDGRKKPDVCAPGILVATALSGSGDGVVVKCGTSMAAPHVTGAVALLLSRAARTGEDLPTASQIAKALRQNTQNTTGEWNRGQGYGVLSVAGLLQGF
jgi:subtilisin family serine protease